MNAYSQAYVFRIIQVWAHATPQDLQEGTEWYGRAWRLARELDPSDPKRGAAVIAVLSPMVSWRRNMRLARDAYAGTRPGCLGANADKAMALVSGADIGATVKGVKVSAFYGAITGEGSAVTIDRHAIDICLGAQSSDTVRADSLRRGGNAVMQASYVEAARRCGVDAHTMQAVTWIAWRAMHATLNRESVVTYVTSTPYGESVNVELSEAIATATLAAEREADEMSGRYGRDTYTHEQVSIMRIWSADELEPALLALSNGIASPSVSCIDPIHGQTYSVTIRRA